MEIQVKSWSPVLDPEYVQPIGDELIHLYRVPVFPRLTMNQQPRDSQR